MYSLPTLTPINTPPLKVHAVSIRTGASVSEERLQQHSCSLVLSNSLSKMSHDYFGFSRILDSDFGLIRSNARNTVALNNAADISVIVVYFVVVLAVGVWVSSVF